MKLIKVINQKQLVDALKVRSIVFCEEQQVSVDIQIDKDDETCFHYVCYDDNDYPLGACRLVKHHNYLKLGRFCVRKEVRNQGIGKFMLQSLETQDEVLKIGEIRFHAQIHALDFYQHCGYIAFDQEFLEAGIPHKKMRKKLHDNQVSKVS